jgi:uncharacterized protein (DUF1800 family)
MTIGPNQAQAVTAFNRFGLGARSGGLTAAAGDPRGFLLDELRTPDVALIRDRAPPSGSQALQAFYLDQQQKRAERIRMAAMAAVPPASSMTPAAASMAAVPGKPGAPKAEPAKAPVEQALFRAEAQARLDKQLKARAGFVERLVAFWSNHFAVSVAKGGNLRVAAGPFEREAIRPNALGKFSALLKAAESHPAMIIFLDNQNSIGPDAAPGKFAGKGLNENLGREILELHTLGVGSGYGQSDVAEFARALTGWSVAGPESEAGVPGGFLFKPNWHEPGVRTILGKTYAESGVEQGRAVLDDLARHPATARHIAAKLARHFVADDPADDLVETLALKFRDSDGDLAIVAAALVADDRAWVPERSKIRTPLEFVVAAARATGFAPAEPGLYLQALNLLGMPLWQPPGPNGFSDASDAWASPEGMKSRLDLASFMGQHMHGPAEPLSVLKTALGDTASRKRCRRSSAPNRASRRWRFCSWRPNSSGDDNDGRWIRFCSFAPGIRPRGGRARRGRDVRPGLPARAGQRGGSARSAPDRRHPARRRRRAVRRSPDRRSGLRRAARRSCFCRIGRRGRPGARRLLFRPSLARRLQAHVRRTGGGRRPCGRDRLPRPIAFRRPGRARKRLSVPRAHRKRLAQPNLGRLAGFRNGPQARARGRRDRAARHPGAGAGARLGPSGWNSPGQRRLESARA